MEWPVKFDDECAIWFRSLDGEIQNEILSILILLRRFGPALGRRRVDSVKGSKHSNMKELRVQFRGAPWRILFAFDPDRKAILLVGGDKTGDNRFYKVKIPIADARFDRHLQKLKQVKKNLKEE